MTRVLQPQRDIDIERERERERRRDGETERRRDGETEREKEGEGERESERARKARYHELRMTCVISFYYGNSNTDCTKKLGTIIPRM